MYVCMCVCMYVLCVCMYVCTNEGIYVCSMYVHLSLGCHLVMVEKLACSYEAQSYVTWNLVHLVVNSFVVRIQTRKV